MENARNELTMMLEEVRELENEGRAAYLARDREIRNLSTGRDLKRLPEIWKEQEVYERRIKGVITRTSASAAMPHACARGCVRMSSGQSDHGRLRPLHPRRRTQDLVGAGV